MKLNKNGWGLVVEVVIILVVIILLVYAIFGLNKLGLIRNVNEALGSDVLPDLVISGKTLTYSVVENNLIEASKDYVDDNYNGDIYSDTTIKISRLIKEGYISTIRDSDNNECSGYVMVTKASGVTEYSPYLKCSEYETQGYNEEYDW